MATVEKRVKMLMLDRIIRLQQERRMFDKLAIECDHLGKPGECSVNNSTLCSLNTCPYNKD